MKLRFVADAKDVLMFVLFAIFLLYIVALGVLNFPQLAGSGTFYGINPIEAFSPTYIGYTLFFYIFALAALFMSVSSYFFEMESGFGFSTSKKDKGYSRWAKEKEMKKVLKCVHPKDSVSEYAGIPLISNGKELWVDDGEYHNLVIGATGSGKTVSTILPSVKVLAKKGESIICTDPKGEIYEKTGAMLKQKGYDIILLNFRNPQKGNAWNPLSLPYRLYKDGNKDKAIELLDDLALNILYEENSGNADPFWEKTSADYFSGLSLAMFEDTTEDKININSISLTTTVGEEKFQGSTYVKEYFMMKDPNSPAYINASGTIMAPNETKGSIIAVFKQKIKLFSSRENLSEMLSYSDFDLRTIGKKPTAVFIIIQDEKKTYHSLATIFVKQCYETLIDVAQENGGKLPCRTNFLLDEFANMPPLKDVTTMITAARSRQIRFTMIIQNFAQLTQVYGKENAETIKGNCGNIIYLISTELAALEEISKLCGEVKSKKDDKTASTPLVTVSDLQRMKQFDQIVLRMRMQPFKTAFTPDFKIDWGGEYGKITYPEREKKDVNVFDVREFVKAKKTKEREEKMKAALDGLGGNPFGSDFSSSSSGGMGTSLGSIFDDMPRRENVSRPSNLDSGFDVNDLIRKVDAKIAELEKEEKEKAQKAQKEQQAKIDNKLSDVETKIDNKISDVLENKPVYTDLPKKNDISSQLVGGLPKKSNSDIEKMEKLDNPIPRPKKEIDLSVDFLENKINQRLQEEIFKEEKDEETIEKPFDPYESLNVSMDDVGFVETDEDVDVFEIKEDNSTDIKDAIFVPVEGNVSLEDEPLLEDIVVDNEEESTTIVEDDKKELLFRETPTIKLSDVSEDDKFFDDFFDED